MSESEHCGKALESVRKGRAAVVADRNCRRKSMLCLLGMFGMKVDMGKHAYDFSYSIYAVWIIFQHINTYES